MKRSPSQEDLLKKIEKLERRLAEAKEEEEILFENLGNTVLNALSVHAVLLDAEGTIIGTNLGWREYGESNTPGDAPDTIGMNYLEVCDTAEGEYSHEATEVRNSGFADFCQRTHQLAWRS